MGEGGPSYLGEDFEVQKMANNIRKQYGELLNMVKIRGPGTKSIALEHEKEIQRLKRKNIIGPK